MNGSGSGLGLIEGEESAEDAGEGNWRKPEKKSKSKEKVNMVAIMVIGFIRGFDGITMRRVSSLSLLIERGKEVSLF